ncbi:MAG TPA: inositol monophosphatase family protein [Candidatus Udaeobacter sp.]|nr:inositol monophosphatase family protein [Candidatus Udaeobacter sp.]
MSNFSRQVHVLSTAVAMAGAMVKEVLAQGVNAKVKDGEPGGSHHSISTEADGNSQAMLLSELRSNFPGAFFLAEEECQGPDLILNGNLGQIKQPGTVFVLDAVDGTAGAYRNRFDWSVVANWIQDGQHQGGAIFAPDIRNGFLVFGEKGQGVFVTDGSYHTAQPARVVERPVEKSTVLYGVDVLKRPHFQKFQHEVAKTVETAVVAGSCGLGVAMVAAGRAEAIVQPHQWPWDWASATIIEAAGGKVQYYHYRGGLLVPLVEPDLPSYNRSNRTKEGGIGFIAGAPDLVGWLWQQLQENWNKQ